MHTFTDNIFILNKTKLQINPVVVLVVRIDVRQIRAF
jgi:hypothetical protein